MTVYKTIDIVGTSGTSISDAIRGAVHRAGETIDDLQWFEVSEIRGRMEGGDIAEFQVGVKLGFRLHAPDQTKSEMEPASRKAGTKQTRTAAAQTAAKKGKKARSDLAKGFREKSR